VLLIYAGFLWMAAGGNDEQLTKAKNIIKASVIGIVIILGGYSISRFILKAANDILLGTVTERSRY